ncbi:putative transposase [Caenispirillum bisanense]|uniref:Mutator family transposase n=1 Tax=Caenispirillum bisanense TaxID=414052 RepID=A0A286GVC3_9PROT|nr:putative transposase [Caenispirillum bisanense]
MTMDRMVLAELLEKGSDSGLLREMISFVAQRLMDCEVEAVCNAQPNERTPERTNSRNGYRDRLWQTRAGAIALKIPKLRQGSYFPPSLSRGASPRKPWRR